MALTADLYLELQNPAKYTKKSEPAVAGTYYSGQEIMIGGDDGYAKPLSASLVANTQVVGFVQDNQTVATTGDNLEFVAGPFAMSGSGITSVDMNRVAFVDGTHVAYDTAGSGRLAAGRVVDLVQGSSASPANLVFIDYGTLPSGSSL